MSKFQIQYTDQAHLQLSRLDNQTCASTQEKLHVISAVDPYAHGRTDPLVECRDRRIVDIETILLTFWISSTVRTITVVGISGTEEGRKFPLPPSVSAGAGRSQVHVDQSMKAVVQ